MDPGPGTLASRMHSFMIAFCFLPVQLSRQSTVPLQFLARTIGSAEFQAVPLCLNKHCYGTTCRGPWSSNSELCGAQVFLYLFFINNLFITSTLIIGGGAVIHALTGRTTCGCRLVQNILEAQQATTLHKHLNSNVPAGRKPYIKNEHRAHG